MRRAAQEVRANVPLKLAGLSHAALSEPVVPAPGGPGVRLENRLGVMEEAHIVTVTTKW